MKRKVTHTKPSDMGLAPELEWLTTLTESPPPKPNRGIRGIPLDDLYDAYAVTDKTTRRRDRNAAPVKRRWEALRRRYTWHLRLSSFDHSHWWEKNRVEIDRHAALYELARRHPQVAHTPPSPPPCIPGDPRNQIRSESYRMFPLPKSLEFLSYFAQTSWAQLTQKQRDDWKSSIGRMKGFDERSEKSLSRNVTSLVHQAIEEKRWREILDEQNTVSPGFNYLGFLHEPTDDERKAAANEQQAAIAEAALKAHRQGFLLLAIAPDLASKKAASLLEKEYREHLRNHPKAVIPKRLRCPEWLKIISAFEDDETRPEKSKTKSDPQLFARYRRVIDGIVFPERSRQS